MLAPIARVARSNDVQSVCGVCGDEFGASMLTNRLKLYYKIHPDRFELLRSLRGLATRCGSGFLFRIRVPHSPKLGPKPLTPEKPPTDKVHRLLGPQAANKAILGRLAVCLEFGP